MGRISALAGLAVVGLILFGCGTSRGGGARAHGTFRPTPTLSPVSYSPTTGIPPAPPRQPHVSSVAQIIRLLNGLAQRGPRLGEARAPVSITLYGDLECPVCRTFVLGPGFAKFVAREVRAGKVRIVYRGFETATADPKTFKTQQIAALAAGRQDRFWQFTMLFLLDQGTEGTPYVTESFLDELARQVPGLNLAQWTEQRNDPNLATQLAHDLALGKRLGVQGTPTLIFQGPRGRAQPSDAVPTYNELTRVLTKVGQAGVSKAH